MVVARPYGRAVVTDISPKAQQRLEAAGKGVRLRVLLALEQERRSTAALAEALDVSFNSADNAVRKLMAAGLVTVVDKEEAHPAVYTMRRVYGCTVVGWQDVVDALEQLEELPSE